MDSKIRYEYLSWSEVEKWNMAQYIDLILLVIQQEEDLIERTREVVVNTIKNNWIFFAYSNDVIIWLWSLALKSELEWIRIYERRFLRVNPEYRSQNIWKSLLQFIHWRFPEYYFYSLTKAKHVMRINVEYLSMKQIPIEQIYWTPMWDALGILPIFDSEYKLFLDNRLLSSWFIN